MKNFRIFLIVVLGLFLSYCVKQSAPHQPGETALPRSAPEQEGLSSEGILNFLDAADSAIAQGIEMHSIMVLRHGKVVAEGWWWPYRPDLKHTLYSTSKSFAASAIGFAADEKKLKLTDKVAAFFPQSLPDTVNAYLADLTIADLLTMSTGQPAEPWSMIAEDDWIKAFFAGPVTEEPGRTFRYNSAATFMLSAILQKVTGEKLLDYLGPRLFEPLGIEDADWETNPQGINTGGWGLRIKTEDMAKFGQLYLQKGKWNGKRLLSEEWVAAATAKQIATAKDTATPDNDAAQGYGYQFWRHTRNGFDANGAFGQYIVALPEKDVIIAMTANAMDMQKQLNLVWNFLYPAIHDNPLPENKVANQRLKERLSSLSLPTFNAQTTSPLQAKIAGKNIAVEENPLRISSFNITFTNHTCTLAIKQEGATYRFGFSPSGWEEGSTSRHGVSLTGRAKNSLAGLKPFKVAGNYAWENEQTLLLALRYIESPNVEIFKFTLDGSNVAVEYSTNFDNYERKTIMEGKID